MKALEKNELAALIQGALRVEERPDGSLCPHRFTEKQEKYYAENTDFGVKLTAGTNIRLEFLTDSDFFVFSYAVTQASSRRFFYFDIYVDGVFTQRVGREQVEAFAGTIFEKMGAGTHRVTIYFPPLFTVLVRELSLAGGATVRPVPKKRRIYILGDSITQGYDARFSSQTYANLLTDALDAQGVNQGVGGEVYRPEMLDADLPYRPNLISVAYGSNDWGHWSSADEMREKATAFYRDLRKIYPRIPIISILPVWRADCMHTTAVGSFEDARRIVREAAEAAGAFIVDGMKLTPHEPAAYSDAFLHPNDLGFKFYAQGLLAALRPLLSE